VFDWHSHSTRLNPLAPELNPTAPATLVAIGLFKGLTARHTYMSFGGYGLMPTAG